METNVLNAKIRSVLGKQVKALRREGVIPAILYGSGIEPVPLELDALEASKILIQTSASTLIDLKVGKDAHKVLVRDVQRDVIRQDPLHIDFLKVAMDVLITAEVPIDLVGESPAVDEQGGILVTGLTEIEVEALPSDLPDRITIDISVLEEIDDSINVADIQVGKGVEILTDPEELIARVIYQAEEIVEEEVEEEEELITTELEPEVIERGKREEEESEE